MQKDDAWKKALKDPYFLTMFVISSLFALMFAYFSIIKYLSLNASGFDLGIESQIYASTMHGHFFYSTLIGESFLAEHFSPIVFLIYPIYVLFPSPITLLILQALAISSSAIFLFLLLRYLLGKNIDRNISGALSIALSVSYLLSPLTESPISFDFHLMVFLNLFVFAAYYFFIKKRWILNATMLILIVSLHSGYVLIAFFIALSEYLMIHPISYLRHAGVKDLERVIKQRNTLFISAALCLSIVYILFVPYLKAYIGGSGVDTPLSALSPSGMASSSLTGLISLAISDPSKLFAYFTANLGQKENFLIYAFSSTGFLGFLSPVTLLGSVPYFGFAYLSKYPSYYTLGYQYTVMLIPFVYLSAAFGIARITKLFSGFVSLDHKLAKNTTRSMAIFIIAILFIGTLVEVPMDPIAPHSLYVKNGAMVDLPSISVNNSSRIVLRLANMIGNTDPFILTTNNLFPIFANDPNTFSTLDPSPTLNQSIYSFKFEYIIYQPSNFWSSAGDPPIDKLASNMTFISHYGVYMVSFGTDPLVIYKLNYSGLPVYETKIVSNLSAPEFLIDSGEYNYTITSNAFIFHNVSMNTAWYGPLRTLEPGKYKVVFYLESINSTKNSNITLSVSSSAGSVIINSSVVYADMLQNSKISEYTMNFIISKTSYGVGFTGTDINWHGTLKFFGAKYYNLP